MSVLKSELCKNQTKSSKLQCLSENLVLIEKIKEFEDNKDSFEVEKLLKYCQICKIVCLEKIYNFKNGEGYSIYSKIPENFVEDCHCIGFLNFVEIISEKKYQVGDPMFFCWEKETRFQCRKCGKYYRESIYQNNFDGVFYQEYSREIKINENSFS